MSIVCGLDFSAPSRDAAVVAAGIAARLGEKLLLLHVLSGFGDRLVPGEPSETRAAPVREQLEQEAERLRGLGAQVETNVVAGSPGECLAMAAEAKNATLIVVGALGQAGAKRWLLGSTAERTAAEARQPLLVVRADRLQRWLEGERPLRVLVGADLSATTDALLREILRMQRAGPLEVHVAHIAWPPEVRGRYGIGEGIDLVELPPEAKEYMVRDLRHRAEPLGQGAITYHVAAGMGRPADHLINLARRIDADLMVVGTSQRTGADRLLRGSVSRGVLHRSEVPVVTVPAPARAELSPLRRLHRILAPTDLSRPGDEATRLAYASVPTGGIVRLVHVVERAVTNPVYAQYGIGTVKDPQDEARQRRRLEEHLRTLVPEESEALGVHTEVEVIESAHPAAAIQQAAERFDADAICMGTHGRTGAAKVVLGSVAQEVLGRSNRPLILSRRR